MQALNCMRHYFLWLADKVARISENSIVSSVTSGHITNYNFS